MIPNIAPKGNTGGYISLEALAIPLIIVLVGLSAFGLGRLSAQEGTKSTLATHQEHVASTTPVSAVY